MSGGNSSTQLWSTMPGWGIVADLLPPEVVAARRVRGIRKVVAYVVLAIVLLAGAGYGYAYWQVHKASTALTAAQAQTATLAAEQQKYDVVVQVQGETQHVQSELGTLLTGDVDLSHLVAAVVQRSPVPSGITSIQVTLTGAAGAAAAPTGADALDMSGHQHIGTITLSGVARTLDQVAAYVTQLSQLPGVVTVFPTSQADDGKQVTYSLQLTLTDQLLTQTSTTSTTTTTTTADTTSGQTTTTTGGN
ncbi:MAG TPA: hypothetical protein VFH38_12455 [Jatrophihabitans sp.]|nr:hypothetical protein [Jatrophihabitans sp.]